MLASLSRARTERRYHVERSYFDPLIEQQLDGKGAVQSSGKKTDRLDHTIPHVSTAFRVNIWFTHRPSHTTDCPLQRRDRHNPPRGGWLYHTVLPVRVQTNTFSDIKMLIAAAGALQVYPRLRAGESVVYMGYRDLTTPPPGDYFRTSIIVA